MPFRKRRDLKTLPHHPRVSQRLKLPDAFRSFSIGDDPIDRPKPLFGGPNQKMMLICEQIIPEPHIGGFASEMAEIHMRCQIGFAHPFEGIL